MMNDLTYNVHTLPDGTQLTEAQMDHIKAHIEYDRIKSLVTKIQKKESVDIDSYLSQFLDSFCAKTRESYEAAIKLFFQKHIHPIDVTPFDADTYVSELSKVYAPNSVRTHLTAISSFFTTMVRWEVIPTNPFRGVKTVKSKRVKSLAVPNEQDLYRVLSRLSDKISSPHSTAYKKVYMAVWLMAYGGFRVGALKGLSIKDDIYTTYSKGRTIQGIMPEGYKEVMSDMGFDASVALPFKDMNERTIQHHVTKVCEELFTEGVIEQKYHAHSFRHYFAVKVYSQTSDIYVVSKRLNHTNVAITQRYLDSIGMIGG